MSITIIPLGLGHYYFVESSGMIVLYTHVTQTYRNDEYEVTVRQERSIAISMKN